MLYSLLEASAVLIRTIDVRAAMLKVRVYMLAMSSADQLMEMLGQIFRDPLKAFQEMEMLSGACW